MDINPSALFVVGEVPDVVNDLAEAEGLTATSGYKMSICGVPVTAAVLWLMREGSDISTQLVIYDTLQVRQQVFDAAEEPVPGTRRFLVELQVRFGSYKFSIDVTVNFGSDESGAYFGKVADIHVGLTQIIRDRNLTLDEAEKYRKIRELVSNDLLDLVEQAKVGVEYT